MVHTDVFGFDFNTFAHRAGWFSVANRLGAFNFVFHGTLALLASTQTPLRTSGPEFTVVVTVVGPTAWDFTPGKLIVPAVRPDTSVHVVFESSWCENFAAWKRTSTVFWGNTCFQIGKYHTFGTDNISFWFAEINAGSVIVLANGVTGGHGVTSLVTFEGAKSFVFSEAGWWWAWSGWRTWWALSGVFWGGWGTVGTVSWAWETDAFDLSVHTVATGALVRLTCDLFTFSVVDTIDFHTEAVFLFQALGTVFRKNGVVDTFATFNTNFLAFFDNQIPSTDVSAGKWTSGNTWVVFSASVALHWAKSLVSPGNMDTLFVTSLSVSSDGGTETFTFSTGITSTGVVLTVFEVVVDVDVGVALGEWTGLIFQNGTSFGGPGLSEWVQSANVLDVNRFWAGGNSFPGISELKNIRGGDVGGGNQIVKNGAVVVTAETLNVGGLVDWVEFDHHMSTLVPHQSDTDFFGFNEDPKTSESESENGVSVGGDWGSSNDLDGRFADFKSDRFGANSTFGTTSFVSSGDFEFTFNFSVNVFTFSLELELVTIEGFDMGVTISLTSRWAFVVSARPSSESAASARVAVFHELLVSSVRFTAVEAWALFGGDARSGFLIENVAFEALATGLAVVIKVWVNLSVDMHVVTSHLHWLFALNVFGVDGANLVGSFASSIGTFPSTFMAFANVAIMGPGFSSEKFSAIPVARAFGWGDAETVVVDNSVSDALARWDASFDTFEFLVLFVSEGAARPVTGFTAFLEFLAGWARDQTFTFFSPVFENDTFFGTGHNVQSGGSANVVHIWAGTVVLLTLVHEWSIIDQIVTFFELGGDEDVTELFGDWVPGFVLNAWFQRVDSWRVFADFSLPFLDEFDNVVFYISFWSQEIVGGVSVKVTAKTSEFVFVFSSGPEVDHLFSVEGHSTASARDHHTFAVDSFNGVLTDVDWKGSDWFVFYVDSTS